MMSEVPRQPIINAVVPGGDRVDIDLSLPADLLWFRGHFRDFPILPGVVQLDWALQFARDHLGLKTPVARTFQVKYKAGLFPCDRVILTLRRHPATSGPATRLTFEYRRDGALCTSGQITVPE